MTEDEKWARSWSHVHDTCAVSNKWFLMLFISGSSNYCWNLKGVRHMGASETSNISRLGEIQENPWFYSCQEYPCSHDTHFPPVSIQIGLDITANSSGSEHSSSPSVAQSAHCHLLCQQFGSADVSQLSHQSWNGPSQRWQHRRFGWFYSEASTHSVHRGGCIFIWQITELPRCLERRTTTSCVPWRWSVAPSFCPYVNAYSPTL